MKHRAINRITEATTALCYILTGAVLVWAISLATQGEGLACGILAAFCGVLIWYAQDEKKTAHVGGMEDRKMDDFDQYARELLNKLTCEEKRALLQWVIELCMKNAASDVEASKAAGVETFGGAKLSTSSLNRNWEVCQDGK